MTSCFLTLKVKYTPPNLAPLQMPPTISEREGKNKTSEVLGNFRCSMTQLYVETQITGQSITEP